MSLRIWLPMTKDLRNQGLSDVTVTNNGATFNSAGKLGGCYSFSGSSQKIVNTLPSTVTSSVGSLSCWIKMNSLPGSSSFYNLLQLGNLGGYATCRLGLYMEYTNYINISIDGSSTGSNRYTHSMVANQWYHICVTYDGTIVKLYIDGSEVLSKTASKGSYTTAASNLYVGGTSSYYLNGYMNDARYYNHCLSPMEIKELSKGLILHYPLNRGGWGQENLITGYDTSFLSYSDGAVTLFSNQMNGGAQEIVSNIGGASKCLHLHSNGGSGRQYGTLSATSGKSYTISCDYYSTSSQTAPFRGELNGGNYSWAGSNAAAYTTPNKWVRLSFSYLNLTSDATIYYFMQCSQNTDCYIKNLKIEEGSIATPWCPNSSDTLATTMGLNGTTEYDTSGYCNNGTRMGTFTWSSDTPKYSVSTQFDSTSTKIQLPVMDFSGMTNSYTFAWWQYNVSTVNMPWGFSNGNRLNCYHCSPLCWNTGDGSSNQFKDGSATIAPTTVQNGWHHMVVTGDGTATKLYIDGVYKGTATTYKPLTGTQIWISGWDSGTSYTFNGSKECDFRIYATALSASDVKSLYQNCATIDADGTIHGQIRS